MKRLVLFATLMIGSLSTSVFAQESTPEPLPDEVIAMFDYDQMTAPEVQEVASETRGDVIVRDIIYPSPVTGENISAYLVVPPGDGPFPGIIYVHWLEPSAPDSNRTEFRDEAVMMAEEYGVASILPDAMWAAPGWYQTIRSLDTDYDDALRQVIELRRGIDVLQVEVAIDPERIGYVGHDFGGMYGSLLSAVDRRAKAYVFIAAASNFNEWMLFGVAPTRPEVKEYMARMDELAPTRFVAQTTPAAILFQFGTEDFYTPEEDYTAFFEAASEPKELKIYETEHAMALDEIRADRVAFLVAQLGLEEQ
jgi:dienelactone hydrolase